jgi:hypothetical protein
LRITTWPVRTIDERTLVKWTSLTALSGTRGARGPRALAARIEAIVTARSRR